jgi:hypothetical protein
MNCDIAFGYTSKGVGNLFAADNTNVCLCVPIGRPPHVCVPSALNHVIRFAAAEWVHIASADIGPRRLPEALWRRDVAAAAVDMR